MQNGNKIVSLSQRSDGRSLIFLILNKKLMKNIIAERNLRNYQKLRPDSKAAIDAWIDVVRKAEWFVPEDVKTSFTHARPIKNSRVVFKIHGNGHRLIAQINYQFQVVYIKFIGTHAEYDRINPETVNMF